MLITQASATPWIDTVVPYSSSFFRQILSKIGVSVAPVSHRIITGTCSSSLDNDMEPLEIKGLN